MNYITNNIKISIKNQFFMHHFWIILYIKAYVNIYINIPPKSPRVPRPDTDFVDAGRYHILDASRRAKRSRRAERGERTNQFSACWSFACSTQTPHMENSVTSHVSYSDMWQSYSLFSLLGKMQLFYLSYICMFKV